MSARRKTELWYREEAGWIRTPEIVELGALHGPGGKLAISALKCAAKLQDEGGQVKIGWRQLAIDACLEGPEQAREIIATAARLGAVAVVGEDDLSVTVQLPGWSEKQRPIPKTDAERAAEYRARKASREHVTERDDAVTNVTPASRANDTVDRDRDRDRDKGSCSPPPLVVARETPGTAAAAGSVPEHFDEVMAILTAAAESRRARGHRPDLIVMDMAILAVLEGRPEAKGHDHVKAAHDVASWAAMPGLRSPQANTLLMAALDNQLKGRSGLRDRPPIRRNGARGAAQPGDADLFDRTRREIAERAAKGLIPDDPGGTF